MNDAGEVLSVTKVANDPVQMSMAIAEAVKGARSRFGSLAGQVCLARTF
jgi:hypothetical protein